ncbi:hypothetical protein DL764_000688 [Monosporascus ibericus]|uniref:Uncharacterized protein n=1 Tax=Monosporascus ibericus TaxID=155417 RepID=A0A4Q4TUW9_9PEZI|nr:hypothetical protein DL764_000688 [Monosporascus ibericus]
MAVSREKAEHLEPGGLILTGWGVVLNRAVSHYPVTTTTPFLSPDPAHGQPAVPPEEPTGAEIVLIEDDGPSRAVVSEQWERIIDATYERIEDAARSTGTS